MWITLCFPAREEWPVVQSSQHHGTGSTKKADIAPPECQKKIRDSPFKLFGRRSEAGVLVAEQLLIVRVRLRDRPSALEGWRGLAGASSVSRKGPSQRLGEPAHDSTQPADQPRARRASVETTHQRRGRRGRTGVPAPESGEHTLPPSPAPNHAAGINTVKRVD